MKLKSLTAITLTIITLTTNAQKKTPTKNYKWEAGLSIGTTAISGDVSGKAGLNTGAWISKPINKWISINARYNHGTAKGMNSVPAVNYSNNTAWADKYAAIIRDNNGTLQPAYIRNGQVIPASHSDQVFYNYKTSINEYALYPKFSVWFPFSKPIIGIHFLTGLSVIQYKTKVDALDGNGNTYAALFNSITPSVSGKTQILNQLKDNMDGVYETNAQAPSKSVNTALFAGIGFSVRIKTRFTVGFECYYISTTSDLLDGQQWQETSTGDAVLTRQYDHITSILINIGYRF